MSPSYGSRSHLEHICDLLQGVPAGMQPEYLARQDWKGSEYSGECQCVLV